VHQFIHAPVGQIVREALDLPRGFVDCSRDHGGLALQLRGGALDRPRNMAHGLCAAHLLIFARLVELVADILRELRRLLA
jgi:hypothetical protein